MKRIGKPTTSGFHHRLTAQRYIKAPNKTLFFNQNLGDMPKRAAYFGILLNLLLYAKANPIIGQKVFFFFDEKLLKDYNLAEFKNKDKLISNFQDSFDTLRVMYYAEMEIVFESKGIEKDKLTNQSFLELVMFDLPNDEPYFDKDLLEPQYLTLIEELRLRAIYKEVTASVMKKSR